MGWLAPGPLPAAFGTGRERLTNDLDTDVCIIGGGLTGVAAAYELAARGTKVVVLEAGRIGSGETGASGGQLLVGTAEDIRTIEQRYGPDVGTFLWDLSVRGLDRVKELASRDGAPCGLRRGHIVVAETEAQREVLEAKAQHWRDRFGYRTAVAQGADLRQHLNASVYTAGAFDPNGGHLDPPAFLSNLALAAERQGARIHEASPALSIDPVEGRVHLATSCVTARRVVATAGPWLGTLVPQVLPYVANIYSYASWLEPTSAQLANLLPSGAAVADSRLINTYFRRLADDRLHFGFPCHVWPAPDGYARRRMTAEIRRIFPSAGAWNCIKVWRGSLGVSLERLPVCGRADRLFWASNYSGQGLVWAIAVGGLIAQAILADAQAFERLASLPRTRIPVESLTWAMPAATLLYLLRYKLEDWWYVGPRG